MDDYLNRGIKEIVEAYPEVANILDEFGIGCGACEAGTCLFKDIVALHPLSEAQEAEFLPVTAASSRINKLQRVHQVIAESCHNHFFEAISKSMLQLTYEIVEAVDPDHQALHMPGEHKDVVAAILNGDAETAEVAMKSHLEHFRENLINMEAAYRRKIAMTA